MKLKELPSTVILLALLVAASCSTPQTPNQNGSNQSTNIEVQITGTESKELETETISQKNCSGTAEVENAVEKSRTIQYVMEVQNGVSVNANGQVGFAGTDVELGATVASQFGQSYGTSETISRSITVKAKPGTNMQHVIRQLEIWKVGQAKISVGGQQTIIPFKFRSDFAIELASSQNLGNCNGGLGETPTSAAVSTITEVPQFSNPLQDIRVRQAIAYCTDRHALAASVNPTLTSAQIDDLMMDSFLPKTHWAYSKPTTQYPFDLVTGRALLEQAGWTWLNGKNYRTNSQGEELRLQLTTTPAQFRQTWAAVFETQMQACGIHLIRLHVDPNWLFGKDTGAGRRDFQLGAWYDDFEENPDVSNKYACDSIPTAQNGWKGSNLTGWCNQAASEAAKKAVDSSLSQDQRKTYFATLQEEFAKDLPILPLFWRADVNGWEHIEFNFSP